MTTNHAANWWLLLAATLTGCSTGDQFRGTDRSALLPSARARWSWRAPRTPMPPKRVAYRPAFEAAVDHVAGDFAQATSRPDYHATTTHAAFAPELTGYGVRAGPIAGLGYGEVEVTNGAAHVQEEGIGFIFGVEAAWCAWSVCEPYARFVDSFGGDWEIRRFEIGIELRAPEIGGIQLAYARQTNRLDDFYTSSDTARIETEGLHIGLSLRF